MRRQLTEEEIDIDLETMYFRRIGGASWEELAKEAGHSQSTIKRMVVAWARDNGKPQPTDKVVKKLISDPTMVDKGKIKALWKAGWKILSISADCNCTEECVREVLSNGIKRV